MLKSNYEVLLEKLDEFIRKYYKNILIRGIINASGIFLAFFLTLSLVEHFGHFNTTVRTILFYSFILGNGYIIVRQILIPLGHLNRFGKIISHEQAAFIIGKHFSEVQDRLLNVLQLQKQQSTSELARASSLLLEASINQKIKELKPVPFARAVNLAENRKYLKYAVVPLLILLVIFIGNKKIITGSTTRLIEHGTYFEKPAPFTFSILNKKLQAVQQEDYQLEVKISGATIPDAAYIEIDGNQYRMEKDNTVSFHYQFKNIQKNIAFRFFGDGYYSKPFELQAIPNPVVLGFDVKLEYPAYLKKASEDLQNTGDLTIPAGTKTTWSFNTRNTDGIRIGFSDSAVTPARQGENRFVFSKRFMRNDSYSVSSFNQFLKNKDSIIYSVTVIPDLYPSIEMEQQVDSFSSKRIFFKGTIKDDYGFSRLSFRCKLVTRKDSAGGNPERNIAFNKEASTQNFFYQWNMDDTKIAAGDEIEYYFEVWDNDGVSGPKSSRSQAMVFKAPTLKEITENVEKKNEEIKSEMKESIQEAKALQKGLSELEKKMMEKKSLSWEEKKKGEDLLMREKELQKKVENIQKENEKNDKKQSEYKEQNPEIAQKHEELKKLMDQLMTEDMKKLMEELEKLMSQTDKQKMQEEMDKMKLSNKDLEKELDRSLELFKQLEVEQKLKETAQNLKDLAKKQDDLSKESLDKKSDAKELQKKQEDLNKEFQDLKKDLKDLEDKNKALESPKDLGNMEDEKKSIDQDMKDSKDQLAQNKKSGASKSEKDAADKMKDLSDKMEKAQQDSEDEQEEEDMESLRALLENLLRLSFDQERLMEDLKAMNISNPVYLKMAQEQRKLKDDAKMIEDSLFALSKRVVQIQSVVNREIASVNDNMDKSIDLFQDRMVPQLRARQQMAMTSVNNLALLLNEALEQMQQQANQKQQNKNKSSGKSKCKKPGSACSKPGKGKPSSAAAMRKMQEQINKQIEGLKESLQQGKKPGNNQTPGGQQGMSEQLARLAAQQQALRQELERYSQENGKNGKGDKGNLGQTGKKMEETESDLVNKMITTETLKRQQDILTRLLEAEKAERERDWDDKRESREGKNEFNRNPDEFAAYKKLKEKEMELLKTVPPSLNPYYKKKVDEYFRNIEN